MINNAVQEEFLHIGGKDMTFLRSGNSMLVVLLSSTVVAVAAVAFSLWHAVYNASLVF